MSNENPYASPQSTAEVELQIEGDWQVDEPYLICKSGAELPPRCVLTNESLGPDSYVGRKLHWARPFRLVVDSDLCDVRFALNPRRQRRIWLHQILVIGSGLLFFPIAWFLGFQVSLFCFVVPVMVGKLVGGGPALKVQRVEHNLFWLEGCCPEFLSECRREQEK